MKTVLKTVIKTLGSLWLAVALISSLAVILIASTTLESVHGTPFVQRFFYRAGWFDAFLALLAVNIFCSAATRFPYQKRHTGFVMTHAGILMLLVGSLLARLGGVDGQMMLYEGETRNEILQNSYQVIVHAADGRLAAFDLPPTPGKGNRKIDVPGPGTDLITHRVLEKAEEATAVSEGPAGSPLNRAIRVHLKSERIGFDDSFWLVQKDPLDPHSSRLSLGPATFELKEKQASPAAEQAGFPVLRVSRADSGEPLLIDLREAPKEEIPLGSGLKILRLRYYPDARVKDNALVNVSEAPGNPAVEFDVEGPDGRHKHYAKFVLFPEFESLHGRNPDDPFGLAFEFSVPGAGPDADGPSLTFYASDNGWTYESKSSKSKTDGEVAAGATYSTGWMDFAFRAEQILDHAVVSRRVEAAQSGHPGQMGVEVSLARNGEPLFRDWVLADSPRAFQTPEGQVIVALKEKAVQVPFMLSLKDFRKVDYPGTNQPVSYESDVALHDEKEKLTIEKTIRMNKPLDYKGYRIFQSSFVQDPAAGEASVFTVAKNPGISLIYPGACVLFAGVFLLFFVRPLSSFQGYES